MIGNNGVPMTLIQSLFECLGGLDPDTVRSETLASERVKQQLVVEVGILDNQQAYGLDGLRSAALIRSMGRRFQPVFSKPVRRSHGLKKGLQCPPVGRTVSQRRVESMVARAPSAIGRSVALGWGVSQQDAR